MTPREEERRVMEQGMRWFRDVCQDTDCPDVDRIKRHVRIAVNEKWLATELASEVPATLADDAKRRTRQALSETNDRPSIRRAVNAHRAWRWAGVGALAAAACLVMIVRVNRSRPTEDSLVFVSAFEQYEEDDLTLSLRALKDDVLDLEQNLETQVSATFGNSVFDTLLDDLDRSLQEAEADDDWS